jgi:HAD superfamily hydrolase (TIGR01509 family)
MGAIRAIFFDQDGVIADTEPDGHRAAFNQAFRDLGLPWEWGVEGYGELLQVSGGKERLRHFLRRAGGTGDAEALVRRLHRRKTEIFSGLIAAGRLPLRPGVRRLMREALAAGVRLAICTTSDPAAAAAIAGTLLAGIRFEFILAGDVVARKKPAPDIYRLALARTGLAAPQCLVIEDSRAGIAAAKAAGLPVLATASAYSRREDLSAADLVVSCLGDPHGRRAELIASRRPVTLPGWVDLGLLERYFAAAAA